MENTKKYLVEVTTRMGTLGNVGYGAGLITNSPLEEITYKLEKKFPFKGKSRYGVEYGPKVEEVEKIEDGFVIKNSVNELCKYIHQEMRKDDSYQLSRDW